MLRLYQVDSYNRQKIKMKNKANPRINRTFKLGLIWAIHTSPKIRPKVSLLKWRMMLSLVQAEKIMRASPALSLSLTIPLPLASTRTRFSSEPLRFKQHVSNTHFFSRPVRLLSKQPIVRWSFSCQCRNRGRNYSKFDDEGEDFIVVNFYRFVSIKDPAAEIEKHLPFLQVH